MEVIHLQCGESFVWDSDKAEENIRSTASTLKLHPRFFSIRLPGLKMQLAMMSSVKQPSGAQPTAYSMSST